MKTVLGNLPKWINNHRWWVAIAYLLIFVLALGGAGKITMDDSLESWFEKDSAIVKDKRQFEEYFGSNEDLYIVYRPKDQDVFSNTSLAALKKLQVALEQYTQPELPEPIRGLTHIRDIRSLYSEQITQVDGDDLFIRPFLPIAKSLTSDEIDLYRQAALANPDFVYKFVSPNGEYGGVAVKTNFGIAPVLEEVEDLDDQLLMVDFDSDLGLADQQQETSVESVPLDYQAYSHFMASVRQVIAEAGVTDDLDIYYTGLPELISFQVQLQQEMGSIFLGLFLLIFAIALMIFRHPSIPVWTLLVIITTLIITLGVIGLSGMPLTSLSQAMLLLVILISVADVVHLVSAYRYERLQDRDHSSAMTLAFEKAGFSCFLTTLTTVVGFMSLWVAKPSVPVAHFGLMASIGLIVAFVTSVTLLPLLLNWWAPKQFRKPEATGRPGGLVNKALMAIHHLTIYQPKVVLGTCSLLILVVALGIARIQVDTNTLESFAEDTEIRQAFQVADSHMGGTQNMDLMIDLGTVDAVTDGRVLRKVDALQQAISSQYNDLVVTSYSIVNVLKQIHQQLNGDQPEFYRLPESNGEISQLLFLFNNASPEERKQLIAEDFDATRVSFSVRNAGSSAYVEMVAGAKQLGAQQFAELAEQYPEIKVTYTGGMVAFVTLFDRVTDAQITSFLVTLVVILITLLLVFRSFRLGLLALVPSLVPVAVTFGLMGWLGIALDSVTMIIAPIILGIAVDDSVHFIRKLQVIEPSYASQEQALKQVLLEIGPALTFTSVVLAGGLLTMLLSSNGSFQHFGYLSAVAIFSALIADLLMIPAICSLTRKHKTQIQPAQVTS